MRQGLIALLSACVVVIFTANTAAAQQRIIVTTTGISITVPAGVDVSDEEVQAAAKQLACGMNSQAADREVSALSQMSDRNFAAELRRLAQMRVPQECKGKENISASTTASAAQETRVMAFTLRRNEQIKPAEISEMKDLFAHVVCASDNPAAVFDSISRGSAEFYMDDLRKWASAHPRRSGCDVTANQVQHQVKQPQCKVNKPGPCVYEVPFTYQEVIGSPRVTQFAWTPAEVASPKPGKPFYCVRGPGQFLVCLAAAALVACVIDYATGQKVCGYEGTPGKTKGTPIPPPINGDVIYADNANQSLAPPLANTPILGVARSAGGGTRVFLGATLSTQSIMSLIR